MAGLAILLVAVSSQVAALSPGTGLRVLPGIEVVPPPTGDDGVLLDDGAAGQTGEPPGPAGCPYNGAPLTLMV